MMRRVVWQILILLFAAAFLGDVQASRRGVRIDGFGTWDEFDIPSASCPGTIVGDTRFIWRGFTFSGREDDAHLFDTYCQIPVPGTLNDSAINYADETGLAELIGENFEDEITAIRYSYLDLDRFAFDPAPTGFQWTFYFFPHGGTLVGLYGLENVTLTSTSYMHKGSPRQWDGTRDGYDGQYFCFDGNVYIGTWDGDLQANSPCLNAVQRIFIDEFE